MKHAVIVGHPDSQSFNLTIAKAYCDAVRSCGHEAVLRDLYRLNFDPVLKNGELPTAGKASPAEDTSIERKIVGDADVFAFVYPLWFYAPPAIVKGYVDRVFSMGFGFGPIRGGRNQPLLTGRSMISFTSSGAPEEWVRREGALAAIRSLFDDHLAGVCGLRVLDHIHFGGVVPNMVPRVVEESVTCVTETVRRFF